MTQLCDAILVVDDEADFARGLARLIQKGFPSHPVVVKAEGQAALNFMQERPCALMITDLRMPWMDGFTLLTQAHAIKPSMSVIVLTGFGTIETAVTALKAGAYDFLTKPIDQDCLYRVVSRGLERTELLHENKRLRYLVATCNPRQTII